MAFALWRVWLTYDGASITRLYNSFDTRADALLGGCGVALLLNRVDLAAHPRVSAILAGSLAPIAAFMVVLGFTANSNLRWYYYVSPLLGTLPALIAIAGLVQPQRTFVHALYAWSCGGAGMPAILRMTGGTVHPHGIMRSFGRSGVMRCSPRASRATGVAHHV